MRFSVKSLLVSVSITSVVLALYYGTADSVVKVGRFCNVSDGDEVTIYRYPESDHANEEFFQPQPLVNSGLVVGVGRDGAIYEVRVRVRLIDAIYLKLIGGKKCLDKTSNDDRMWVMYGPTE